VTLDLTVLSIDDLFTELLARLDENFGDFSTQYKLVAMAEHESGG
jgi:hypothetical protein